MSNKYQNIIELIQTNGAEVTQLQRQQMFQILHKMHPFNLEHFENMLINICHPDTIVKIVSIIKLNQSNLQKQQQINNDSLEIEQKQKPSSEQIQANKPKNSEELQNEDLQIIHLSVKQEDDEPDNMIGQQENIEKFFSSQLKSNQIVLIVSNQTQTLEIQIRNLIQQVIDSSLTISDEATLVEMRQTLSSVIDNAVNTSIRQLQNLMNDILKQIINASTNIHTYIYPPLPFKKKEVYTLAMDQFNKQQNIFFTTNNQLTYNQWQLLLIIITKNQIKDITVLTKDKNYKLQSQTQIFKPYYIHFYTLKMFTNDINHHQIKFKQKQYFREATPIQFKLKEWIRMYRGKSIAIYDLIEQQQETTSTINYSLLLSIKYLIKSALITKQLSIAQIYKWLKLLTDIYNKQLPPNQQKTLFADKSMFMGFQVSELYIYLLYGIYREQAPDILDKYSLIKNMELKGFLIQKWQKSVHYESMQLLYIQYLLYNKFATNSTNWQFMDNILKRNLTSQSNTVIKRILVRCSIENPNILVRLRVLVDPVLLQNQEFSVNDFLIIKSRYLSMCFKQIQSNNSMYPYYRAKQLQQQDNTIIMFVKELIIKNQTSNIKIENNQIEVNKQGLMSIFLKSIRNWFGSSYQLRISDNKFCTLYMQLKELLKANAKIGQMLFSSLFSKSQNFHLVLLQKHSVMLMILMLINPVLSIEQESLTTYMQRHKFNNNEVNQLIDLYLKNIEKISQKMFLDTIIAKILENSEFQFYSIFKKCNQIYQIQNYPYRDTFNKIFSTLLSNLKISITQKTIFKHIKNSFLLADNQLKIHYVKKICQQIKRQVRYDEHFYNIINKFIPHSEYDKRDLFISIYFQNENSVIEEVQQKLWACLVKNIQYLPSIKTRFRISFQPSAMRIMKRVQANKITSEQLNALNMNLNQIKQYISNNFILLVAKSYAEKERYFEKLKLIQYVLGKCEKLSETAYYFTKKQIEMKVKNLEEIYFVEKEGEQKWPFQFCEEIRILMSYQFSLLANCQNIDQFKIQFQKQKKQLIIIYQKYKQSKLTVQEMHRYFGVNLVADSCDIFCKQKQMREQIIKSANKLHMKNIIKLQQYVLSYLNLVKCLQVNIETSNFQMFTQVISNIRDDPSQVQVVEPVQLIQLVQRQISEVYGIKLDINNPMNFLQQLQNNQITHIIKSTYTSMPLFNMIQTKKIDQRSIADLKEYINDQENSSLKLDSIKEFQNVLDYWNLLRGSTTIKQYLSKLEKKVEKNPEQIWKHIDNCNSIYRLIRQKLDEASNRQTSFKYQIEAIFQNSILSIKKIKDSIDIQVITTSLLTNVSLMNKQLIIEYKRLETFKDKSILLISDIERQQNQDENIQKTLAVFKRFEEYFAIVENIHYVVKQLLSYGYNTQFLISNINVTKNDFRQLIQKQQQLQKMCGEWVKGIKELYKQSYLLTHFIGSQLSVFIQRCLKNQYHPSLYSILKLTQAQFQQITKDEVFKTNLSLAAKSQPLQQLILIVKLYLTFESHIRMNENMKDGKIVVENVVGKYYYCCLFEQDKISQPNRVFYCLQQTKTSQIEVFLWRALIDSSRTYYFIGVHNLKQQIKLYFENQLLYLLQSHKQAFLKARFTFIDDVSTDKFYSFLFKSKLFNIVKNEHFDTDLETKTQKMINLLPQTRIVQSAKAGLGKTYRIQQLAHEEQKQVKYFPISGNIQLNKLANRLKKLKLNQNQCLSISLFEVQDWKKIQVFLSQIILFRSFYYEEFVFLPEKLWIFIEVENIYQQRQQNMYPLMNLLTKFNRRIFIEQFQIHLISFDNISPEEKFVFLYLQLLNQPGAIANKQLYFQEIQIYGIPENGHELIERYFCSWFANKKQIPTFTTYNFFMKMLYKNFKAFSDCEYLKVQHVNMDAQFQFLESNKTRQAFLNICIQNVLQFLQQTFSSNDFTSNQNNQAFSQIMRQMNLLILPSERAGNYQFVYTEDRKVPFCIKSILLTQNYDFFNKIKLLKNQQQVHHLFESTALNKLDEQFLQFKLQQMLISIADLNIPQESMAYFSPNFDQYKLTLDNFMKICLIWHRASSGIPCILMGQSGVGKTKLIQFFVQQILQNMLIVINLHAGMHQDELVAQVQRIKKYVQDFSQFSSRIWVFFDEFNTCDQLGYIKQMIIDHRFMGEPLPQKLIIVAACNPYRKKKMGRLMRAGIQRPATNQNQLAFTVKAPPLSMVQLMWDYQQLRQAELKIYIQKMLQTINYPKKKELIDSIVFTHQFLSINVQISSASLRDVTRFRKIYKWFDEFMPMKSQHLQDKNSNPNYKMDRSQRCIILTYSFCYCLRLANNEYRQYLYTKVEQRMNFSKGWMKQVLFNQQIDYISRLTISDEQIALNTALIENTFTCLVCLLNKIPILLIGNPGSSKSLSMRLIQSNMRGQSSQSEFCNKFPQLNVLYFQGSQSSTSKGVEQIFEKAHRWKNEVKKNWKIQQCILFDQIGLAEKSIHNPLKVLHSKLQTSSEQICFIGISNWQLDLAKMSRFLVLARSTPDKKDLAQTAFQIARSFLGASSKSQFINYQISQKKWESLGYHYYAFINEWEKNPNNKKHFFGLRDFYGYVKFICSEVIREKGKLGSFERAIDKSIQINFDGQPGSVQLFQKIVNSSSQQKINPLQLIQFNLQRPQSRCLLLIFKGDSLVSLINKGIDFGNQRKIICIHGSTFSVDQESQEYNQEMTALTINHISRGNVLAFKDINNSIQTSLYDLFNKSFTKVGNKRYCRIAVGANSNPKCLVHHNFNAIVYIDQARLELLDPPFLNRFEKHYLNIQNMINNQEKNLVQDVKRWVEEILSFRNNQSILKTQQFILNSGRQSIITLVIKHRKSLNPMERIKNDLLLNQTTDFLIGQMKNEQINKIINKDQDYIIFTYDEFRNLSENSLFQQGFVIHIEQIESQKELRTLLKKSMHEESNNIQIYLNYQNHRQHLSFILFMIDEVKTSFSIKKQFLIIIQMHRFSLHHLRIDHVNLSYLHPFQQIFLQTLNTHKQKQLDYIIKAKDQYEAYKILEMNKSFSTHFTEMLKCCKFTTLHQKNDGLARLYFEECLLLRQQKYFVQCCLKQIEKLLINKQIDFRLLQQNNEAIIFCSNILQAIEKHIEGKVKQIIFDNLKLVIQKGLLFHLNLNVCKYQKQISQNLTNQYNFNKDFIYCLGKQQFQEHLLKVMSKDHYYLKKGVLQNIILISEEVYFLPIMKSQCSNIFNQNSLSTSNQKLNHQSSNEEINQFIKSQKEIMQAKSKICKIYYRSKQQTRQFIQKCSVFDILTYILLRKNRKRYNIQKIGNYLLTILKDISIEQKIIFLGLDFTFTILLLDLLQSLSLNQQLVTKALDIICFKPSTGNKQLVKDMSNSILQALSLSVNTISKFKSLQQYSLYFASIYKNIREFNLSFSIFEQAYIQKIEITHQFLIFINNQKENIAKSIIQKYEQNKDSMTCIQIIFTILSKDLSQSKDNQVKEQIASFLSNHILSVWMRKRKQQHIQLYSDAIKMYLKLANSHIIIANKSASIFQIIFQFNYSFQSLSKCLQYIKNKRIDEVQDIIDFKNHASVALGFYLSKIIKDSLNPDCENMNNQQLSALIVKGCFETFKQLIESYYDQQTTKIQKTSIIQFSKLYCSNYLIQLTNHQNKYQLLDQIDAFLCRHRQIILHLRLYMTKYLVAKYGSFQKVRRYFIEMKRCNWIYNIRQLLEQERTEIILPITPKDEDYNELIQTFNKSNFTNIQCFHLIITEGLETSQRTYLMLNYFLTTFYMKNSPEQYISLLLEEVQTRKDLNTPQNFLIKKIINMYLRHKICHGIQYNFKQQDTPIQIILLNYLNAIVSCRKIKSPLCEMFFNEKGHAPERYSEWIRQRYLIGSIDNPAVERIYYLLKKYKGDAGLGYYIVCTEKQCCYMSPVGGFFNNGNQNVGCGSLDPGSYFKCNLCGKMNKILQDNTYEGKIIDEKQMLCQKELIYKIHSFTFSKDQQKEQIFLKGYQFGASIQRIKQILILKQHLFRVITDYMEPQPNFANFKILQSLTYFMWLILFETQQIPSKQFESIFSISQKQISERFISNSKQLLKSANGSIEFKQKEEAIVWHFTLAHRLFQKLMVPVQNSSLIFYKNKHDFQFQMDELIKQMSGSSKQKIIVENRKSLIINKSQILKQFGNVQLHQQEYNLIKMFKILQQDNQSSKIQRLKKYKLDILSKQYPLLSYILNLKQRQKQKLSHFYNILLFISKLTALNLKISRSDSNQSILEIVQQYFCQTQSEKDKSLGLMRSCIKSWNQLAKSKYKLQDGCNFIGFLEKIDQHMPIKHLILDKNNLQNMESRKLAQFISTIAIQYNEMCQIMQNLGLQNHHKFMSELKMNPSSFNGQNYLQLPLNILQQSLTLYSYYSVEYGLKELQYQLQKINSLMMKQLNGCRYFIANKEQFQYIQYIGQDNSFMIFIREDAQISLQLHYQQKLIEYFKKQEKIRGQTFYKFVKQLMGSLQNLIVCFKNKRNFKSATIGQFVNQFRNALKVKNFNKQLNEDPIQSLSVFHLGALYETLENITFKYNVQLLSPIYCLPLQNSQIRVLESFFDRMKNKSNLNDIPSLTTFKFVVQRFISRILLLGTMPSNNLVINYLCEIYWLWPKGQHLENYSQELKKNLDGIQVRKIYSITKLIEKAEKKSQEIHSRQKDNILMQKQKQVKVLKKIAPTKKRRDKKQLD